MKKKGFHITKKGGDRIRFISGYDIFISYTHSDGLEYAHTLKKQLEAEGYTCFIDESEITYGESLSTTITKALKRSVMLVVILTADSAAAPWIKKEAEWFRRHRPKGKILPAFIHPITQQNLSSNILISDNLGIGITERDAQDKQLTSERICNAIKQNFTAIKARHINAIIIWSVVVFLLLAAIGVFILYRQGNYQHWKDIALAAKNEKRYDKAVLALSLSSGYAIKSDPQLDRMYREVRSNGVFSLRGQYDIEDHSVVLSVHHIQGHINIVLFNDSTGIIYVRRDDTALAICAVNDISISDCCSDSANFYFYAADKLYRITLSEQPQLSIYALHGDAISSISLRGEDIGVIAVHNDSIRILFLRKSDFQPSANTLLKISEGDLVLSANPSYSFIHVEIKYGDFHIARYDDDFKENISKSFPIPGWPSELPLIDAVNWDKDGSGIFISYTTIKLAISLFGSVPINPGSNSHNLIRAEIDWGLEPLIISKSKYNKVVPGNKDFGNECVFLDDNKTLSRMRFHPPIIDHSPLVMGNDIEDFIIFGRLSNLLHKDYIVAADKRQWHIYINGEEAMHYPAFESDFVRLLHSADDSVIAIRTHGRYTIWQLVSMPPAIGSAESISEILGLTFSGDSLVYQRHSVFFRDTAH